MTKICIIRHGQTDWNVTSRLQGQTDTVLNNKGREQARQAGLAIKEIEWHSVISSPLLRAKETAEIVSEILGLDGVATDDGLRERSYGQAEGLTLKERTEAYPDRQYEGMEDWEALRDRMMETIQRYASDQHNLVLVSHGAAINSVLHTLSGGAYGSGITKLHNGCITMLTFSDQQLIVDYYNRV